MENNEKYAVCEGGYGSKTAADGQAEQPMEQQVPEKQTNGLYRFGYTPRPIEAELVLLNLKLRMLGNNPEAQAQLKRLRESISQ